MIDKIPSWLPYVIVTIIGFGGTFYGFTIHMADVESEFRKELTRHEKKIDAHELRIRNIEISTGKMYQTILHLDKTVTENSRKLDLILTKFTNIASK